MSPDRAPTLCLVLAALAGTPLAAHGQASVASALAGASLVPAAGSAAGVSARPVVGGMPVRVGEIGSPGRPAATGGGASFTTAEAADFVLGQRGRPTLLIFYRTTCSRSQAMFPAFVALAAHHAARNLAVVAFAVRNRGQDVPPFLANYAAPFQPLHIRSWPPGQMSRDMATIGLRIPSSWNLPHVAVLDASGGVVGQWDAATDIRTIDAALSSLP